MQIEASNANAELKRIAERIVALCEASSDKTRPYLLSRLGLDLGDDLGKLRQYGYPKLAQFINVYLQGRYEARIIGGEHNNIYAIIGVGAPTPTINQSTATDVSRAPRFHYRFWAAFAVPLTNEKRYLNLLDFMFKDLSSDELPPPGAIQIESEYIAEDGFPDRDTKIIENIDKWLSQRIRKSSCSIISSFANRR